MYLFSPILREISLAEGFETIEILLPRRQSFLWTVVW